MAEQMSKTEIEDVLASIRRLVSEEGRGSSRRPADPPPADKLVLTPALRVEAIAKPASDEAGPAVPEPAEAEVEVIPPEAAEIIPDDDFAAEPDAAPDDRTVLAALPEIDTAGPPSIEDLLPDDHGLDPRLEAAIRRAFAAGPYAALESTIAELEVAVAARPEEWEPDGSEDMPLDYLTSALDRPAAQEAAAAEDGAAEAAPEEAEVVPDDTLPIRDEDVADTLAEAEPVVTAAGTDEAEPVVAAPEPEEEPVTDADAGAEDEAEAAVAAAMESLDWEDEVEPAAEAAPRWGSVVAEPAEALADSGFAEEIDDADDEDDALIDEEVLRDLVRDLIREELQGALGEKITRNVRKLVRAEIARALAAQDLG